MSEKMRMRITCALPKAAIVAANDVMARARRFELARFCLWCAECALAAALFWGTTALFLLI